MSQLTTLFVEHLSTIDFSYLDAQRGVVGESLIVDIELTGELNEQGMLYDFGHIKKVIKQKIDETVDHQFVIPGHLNNIMITADAHSHTVTGHYGQGLPLFYQAPHQATTVLDTSVVDIASIKQHLEAHVRQALPENVDGLCLSLRPESIVDSFYHYSHGLKHHDGNCQRIVHGHRSKLFCFEDTLRRPDLEHYWCQRWQDIYLASEEDLVKHYQQDGVEMVQFAYESQQGFFQVDLPQRQVEIVPYDTTVECITRYIAETLRQEHANKDLHVRNYEGVDKGAVY